MEILFEDDHVDTIVGESSLSQYEKKGHGQFPLHLQGDSTKCKSPILTKIGESVGL